MVPRFFCVWIERKFLGLGSNGKKFSGFVFKFVGWICVYVCWLGLIGGGGLRIFLCLGREKISRFGFGWKENSVFRFVFLSFLIWVQVIVFFMFFPKTNEFFFLIFF